jgi:hypothetical protein
MAMVGIDRQATELCIDQCLEVVKLAARCSDECLKSDRVTTMRECIGLCLDATGVAGLCAEMMAADSRFGTRMCGLCADVCQECSDECARHEGPTMNACVEACRRCADTCRSMAA